MNGRWRRFKAFWTAEEIPRWFSVSLIGIILLGLCAVGYLNVREARDRYAQGVVQRYDASLSVLANTLGCADPHDRALLQQLLRSYTFGHPCERLRVVDENRAIVASIDVREFDSTRPDDFELDNAFPVSKKYKMLTTRRDGVWRVAFGMPIPRPNVSDTAAAPRLFVEGVWLAQFDTGSGLTTAGTYTVIIIVVGLFFMLHRMMRRHFSSMSRISENLIARGDQIENDLHALRLSDSQTQVAEQWNRLIDLVEDLSATRHRADATAELTQALEKSKRGELADVVDLIPHGLFHVGEGGVLTYANPVAKTMLRLPPDHCEKLPLQQLETDETGKAIIQIVQRTMQPDGTFANASENVQVDAGHTTFRVRVLPFPIRHRRHECVVMVSDISQQIRAEQASTEFVSQVTHELRTPLTNIRAYAETLSSGVFEDTKTITDCYNVITKETRRLSRLIEDILSMSQLEVGSLRLHLNDVDLTALLTESVRDIRGLADEKQIDMQLSLPSKLPTVRGDRDKLAVVINNLLGNALKYTPKGGQVLVGCKLSGQEVMITVKDNGIGIDAEDHERIFQKFQRGANPEVGDIEGTGIGLTTAREIARQHRGDVEVMSIVGQGATFIVKLPFEAGAGTFSTASGA